MCKNRVYVTVKFDTFEEWQQIKARKKLKEGIWRSTQ